MLPKGSFLLPVSTALTMTEYCHVDVHRPRLFRCEIWGQLNHVHSCCNSFLFHNKKYKFASPPPTPCLMKTQKLCNIMKVFYLL